MSAPLLIGVPGGREETMAPIGSSEEPFKPKTGDPEADGRSGRSREEMEGPGGGGGKEGAGVVLETGAEGRLEGSGRLGRGLEKWDKRFPVQQ